MNKILPLKPVVSLAVIMLMASCAGHKYYTSSFFEQQTRGHKSIAVLPAEMIFTGVQPKNITPEQTARLEETESRMFQNSLYNGILRHANSKKYYTSIMVQDISTTQKLLEENNISIRDSWKEDDKKLAKILGVDAVVRMRIQKKRYMSDLASMGIGVGQQVLYQIGASSRLPLPNVSNKTNDIYASCNVVSNNQTLWNDNYSRGADYNVQPDVVIDDITDNFGRHFPYRKRR
ncbi:MAG TPA: hypothetical protein VNR87_14815 [Flavisolibacter sp.]|nr:hypothetical protein [Flavisolibacter sp.]